MASRRALRGLLAAAVVLAVAHVFPWIGPLEGGGLLVFVATLLGRVRLEYRWMDVVVEVRRPLRFERG